MRFFPFPSVGRILIIFAISTCIALSIAQESSLISFPNQWELGRPFEAVLVPQAAPVEGGGSFEVILEAREVLSDRPIGFLRVNECLVQINDQRYLMPLTPVIGSGQITAEFTLSSYETFSYLRFTCDIISLQRPSSDTVESTQLRVSVLLKRSLDDPTALAEYHEQNHVITDTPTIVHTYQWANDQRASIRAIFKFYRPAGFDETQYYIYHPLLDIGRITSMHGDGEAGSTFNPIEDLGRPYHLLNPSTLTELSCRHSSLSQLRFVQRDPNEDWHPLSLQIEPHLGQGQFTCEFILHFPPDVLGYILGQQISSQGKIKIMTSAGNDGPIYEIPIDIPQNRMILYNFNDLRQDYVGAHVWTSPHHMNIQYPTDGDENGLIQVEFGIATADRYYNGPTTIKGTSAPKGLVIILEIEGRPDIRPSLSAWSAHIACRDHSSHVYPESVPLTSDVDLDLSTGEFMGFGKTCRLELRNKPLYFVGSAPIQVTFHYSNGITSAPAANITLFNSIHIDNGITTQVFLYDMNQINENALPPPEPLTLTHDESNTNNDSTKQFYYSDFYVQFLSSRSPSTFKPISQKPPSQDTYYLHFFFAPLLNTREMFTTNMQTYSLSDLTLTYGHSGNTMSSESSIFSYPNLKGKYLSVDYSEFIKQPHQEEFDQLFSPFKPNRLPSLAFAFPLSPGLHSTSPVKVRVRFPIVKGFDVSTVNMIPVLLPSDFSHRHVYSPHFARITPVSPKLSGYFYRCVTWDQLAAPYVYGTHAALPLTHDTSFDCPRTIAEYHTGLDLNIVRKNIYTPTDEKQLSKDWCYYEAAAVCVTSQGGDTPQYNVHPLADCPSLLGATHAIPCSAIDNPGTEWPYTLEIVSEPQPRIFALNTRELPELQFQWKYRGDPRLTLTLSVAATHGTSMAPSDLEWIVIGRAIPAILPSWSSGVYTTNIPLFDPSRSALFIKLTLDSSPHLTTTVSIKYSIPWHSTHGCSLNESKRFNIDTHLCECDTLTQSSYPITVETPLGLPHDLRCTPPCGTDHHINWDREYGFCSYYGYSESQLSKCHTIPKFAKPPFSNPECGFGLYEDLQTCSGRCTCFTGWTSQNQLNGLCTQCQMQAVCNLENTDPITFSPHYCQLRRCFCKPGFGGERCQYRVVYVTLVYENTPSSQDYSNSELIDATLDSQYVLKYNSIQSMSPLIQSRVKTSLGDTPTNVFVHQVTQVFVKTDGPVRTTIMVALTAPPGSLPSSNMSIEASDAMDTVDIMDTTHGTPHTSTNTSENPPPSPFNSIYYAWKHAQTNLSQLPIAEHEVYGTLMHAGDVYDPHCYSAPSSSSSCPQGDDTILPPSRLAHIHNVPAVDDYNDNGGGSSSSSSSDSLVYIIIGASVGGAILIMIIACIIFCKVKQIACFRRKSPSYHESYPKTNEYPSPSPSPSYPTTEMTVTTTNTTAAASTTPAPTAPAPAAIGMTTSHGWGGATTDQSLPYNWVSNYDPNSGSTYYTNTVTKEVTWTHPGSTQHGPSASYFGW